MTDDSETGALLTQSVLRRLRDEIFEGILPPGTSLSVPGLAARLEVSRSPVREAVQQTPRSTSPSTPRCGRCRGTSRCATPC